MKLGCVVLSCVLAGCWGGATREVGSAGVRPTSFVLHTAGRWTYEDGVRAAKGLTPWIDRGYTLYEDTLQDSPPPTALVEILLDYRAVRHDENLERDVCRTVGAVVAPELVDEVCK